MKILPLVKHAPIALLAASSIFLNTVLIARVVRQQEIIVGLTPPPVLPVGKSVGPVEATTLDGRPVTLATTSRVGRLYYVYSASCGWCVKNAENMRVVIDAARARGFEVYALALSATDAATFLESHRTRADILLPTAATREGYHLGGTPQTLLISADGKVLKNWRGAFVGKTAEEVESYFQITLPGLPSPMPVADATSPSQSR